LIHGTDSSGEACWIQSLYNEILNALGILPNVVIYDWREAADLDYQKIDLGGGNFEEIFDQDESIGIIDDLALVRGVALGQGYLLDGSVIEFRPFANHRLPNHA